MRYGWSLMGVWLGWAGVAGYLPPGDRVLEDRGGGDPQRELLHQDGHGESRTPGQCCRIEAGKVDFFSM